MASEPKLRDLLDRVREIPREHQEFLVQFFGPTTDLDTKFIPAYKQPMTFSVLDDLCGNHKFGECFELLDAAGSLRAGVINMLAQSLFYSDEGMAEFSKGKAERALQLIRERFERNLPKPLSVLLSMVVICDRAGNKPPVYSTSAIGEVMGEASTNQSDLGKLTPLLKSMMNKSRPDLREVDRGAKKEWVVAITTEGLNKLHDALTPT